MRAIYTAINHILTTQRNCFEFVFGFFLGQPLTKNRNKFDWETLNTPKIKTVFYSAGRADSDFGTRIRLKCHQQIQRIAKTIEGEICTNWEQIDSFGVILDFDDSIHHYDGYKIFYDDLSGNYWTSPGTGL